MSELLKDRPALVTARTVPPVPSWKHLRQVSNHLSLCSTSWEIREQRKSFTTKEVYCMWEPVLPLSQWEQHRFLQPNQDPKRLVQVLVGEFFSCVSDHHTVRVGLVHAVKLWQKSWEEKRETFENFTNTHNAILGSRCAFAKVLLKVFEHSF